MTPKEISESLPSMNTEAVALVLEGKLSEGISALYTCLGLAMELDASKYLPVSNTVQFEEESMLSPISLDEVMHTQNPSNNISPDNCFIFFRNVFVLEGFQHVRSQSDLKALALTVLFNLAVVCQEVGLGSGDFDCLSESIRHYQVMLDLCSRSQSVTPVSLLEMSLYNNLGHLLAFFSDKDGVLEMRLRLFDRLERCSPQPDHWGFKHLFRCSLSLSGDVLNNLAPAA